MSDNRFHLGWFLNFVVDAWNEPWGGGGNPWNGDFYVELAQAFERAKFDYMILEDKLMVSDAYGGTFETDLKHALFSPKHDPVPLVPLIARATKHLGIVPTLSTSFYPPFLLARLCSTLDHITEGRLGWNIVTSAEDRAAQNFGLDKLYAHDLRYEMADEYVDLVTQLWDSWEPDAVVLDREKGIYADYTKVHAIDFEGKYYKSRGPLNTVPSPQRRPVFCQAGGSPKGRDFAAKYADTVIAAATGVAGMKEYRDDIRDRMVRHGRKPDECKVLFLVTPILADTNEEARAKAQRMTEDPHYIEQSLGILSAVTEIDFSKFDLDQPLPDDISTNGERGSLEKFVQRGSGKTLRQLVLDGPLDAVDLIGTPDAVADTMGEIISEVGGDGFLFISPGMRVNRRYVTEITDGLVPALQRRGLTRTHYAHQHFRDNLLDF
jgi:FMN-dependent oxidoreductase (nitrilotriacetate monooxygenase family)